MKIDNAGTAIFIPFNSTPGRTNQWECSDI